MKYDRFRADCFFFGRSAAWFKHQLKKKHTRYIFLVFLKIHRSFQQKNRETDRTRVKGPYKFSCPDLMRQRKYATTAVTIYIFMSHV